MTSLSSEKDKRLCQANELISVINSVEDPHMRGEYFMIDEKGMLLLKRADGKEACHGSGISLFVSMCKSWIISGSPVELFTTFWGYSTPDMLKVYYKAFDIGMIERIDFWNHEYGHNGRKASVRVVFQ